MGAARIRARVGLHPGENPLPRPAQYLSWLRFGWADGSLPQADVLCVVDMDMWFVDSDAAFRALSIHDQETQKRVEAEANRPTPCWPSSSASIAQL